MASALEAFRAQREAIEDLRAKLEELTSLVQATAAQASAQSRDPELRRVLQEEQNWLRRAQDAVEEVRALREEELRRYWPAVWRRWVVAISFALVSSAAFGAGYVWAARPDEAELSTLRVRVELLDFVASRVMRMTPAERRQFDKLMGWDGQSRR